MGIQDRKRLLLATNNQGKVAELRSMLSDTRIEILHLGSIADVREVEETGATFRENARLKAAGYAMQAGAIALADDSGLEVHALGNRPGVLSARYGGADTDFPTKMALLLDELKALGAAVREATFVCALAVADPAGGILFESEGLCAGSLAAEPRGRGGFGYDPLFIPHGYEKTFGELPETIKQKISHRAVAFRHIIPFLRRFYGDLT